MVFIRSHHNYDVEQASDEAMISEFGPSLTVQSMRDDADLNVLMERFGVTGKFPEAMRVPSFGDFSGITDYQSALHAVMEAEVEFESLPAKVRDRFHNNPQELLAFCESRGNLDEAQKLGLLKDMYNDTVGKSGSNVGVQAGSSGVGGEGNSAAAGVGASGAK